MIYTENTKKALELAFEKHKNQKDKSGIPYIYHPFYIATKMNNENEIVVALLHDVIEDTNTTINDLKNIGFNNDILDAVDCMTHYDGQDYHEYIKKLSKNPIALKVKIEDLKHNLDITRLTTITKEDEIRVKRYKSCLKYLLEVQNNNN